jgi:hypothetical protein
MVPGGWPARVVEARRKLAGKESWGTPSLPELGLGLLRSQSVEQGV